MWRGKDGMGMEDPALPLFHSVSLYAFYGFLPMFPSLIDQKLHFLSPISIKPEIKIVKFFSSFLSILYL